MQEKRLFLNTEKTQFYFANTILKSANTFLIHSYPIDYMCSL